MESRSRLVVVASLALLLTSANAQMAPAPGPFQTQGTQGLINGAPANVPPTPNSNPNTVMPGANNNPTGIPSAPAPGGLPMPPPSPASTTGPGATVTTPTTPTSPSSPKMSPSSPSPPSPTSPPVTSAPAPPTVVAFITKLSVDTPNTFYTAKPDGVNTLQQLWCLNLVGSSGATCSATATAGSVNVDTVLTYPPTQAAASAATSLTNTLQAIAANPGNASLIGALIPVIPGVNTTSLFGFEGVSGIQTETLSLGPVGSPYRAPAMAPGFPPTTTPLPPITFTFVVRLGLANPAAFTPALQALWCSKLTAGTNNAGCNIRSVLAGSAVVTTDMTYAASDSASEGALASRLQAIQSNPSLAASFFGNDFGTIEVLSIGTSAVPPPPPPPAGKHGLSGGKIAGAVIGSVAGAAILGGCGFAGYKYYHTRRAYQPAV